MSKDRVMDVIIYNIPSLVVFIIGLLIIFISWDKDFENNPIQDTRTGLLTTNPEDSMSKIGIISPSKKGVLLKTEDCEMFYDWDNWRKINEIVEMWCQVDAIEAIPWEIQKK